MEGHIRQGRDLRHAWSTGERELRSAGVRAEGRDGGGGLHRGEDR
jgi:hypothetical protein